MANGRVLTKEETEEARRVFMDFCKRHNSAQQRTRADFVELPGGNLQLIITLIEQHNMGPEVKL